MESSNNRLNQFLSFILGAYAASQILLMDDLFNNKISISIKIYLGIIIFIGWIFYILKNNSPSNKKEVNIEKHQKIKTTIIWIAVLFCLITFVSIQAFNYLMHQ
jgi:heme/copper-type cytochrome/quinol oxidase subunit 2